MPRQTERVKSGRLAARRSSPPRWVWLVVAIVLSLPVVGLTTTGVVWVLSARGKVTQPKVKVSDIHKAWMGRSMHDWMREYGEADRNDYIGMGGQFIYNRPLAISDMTGKPCGLEVKITEGTVDWVTEYPLK